MCRAAGGWSFALSDYLQQGCMGFLNKPEFLDLAAIVDPYTYRYVAGLSLQVHAKANAHTAGAGTV